MPSGTCGRVWRQCWLSPTEADAAAGISCVEAKTISTLQCPGHPSSVRPRCILLPTQPPRAKWTEVPCDLAQVWGPRAASVSRTGCWLTLGWSGRPALSSCHQGPERSPCGAHGCLGGRAPVARTTRGGRPGPGTRGRACSPRSEDLGRWTRPVGNRDPPPPLCLASEKEGVQGRALAVALRLPPPLLPPPPALQLPARWVVCCLRQLRFSGKGLTEAHSGEEMIKAKVLQGLCGPDTGPLSLRNKCAFFMPPDGGGLGGEDGPWVGASSVSEP